MSLPRGSLFSGAKVKLGGLKAMWHRTNPRFVAVVALIFVTGVMLRLGLASSPQCTITELSLGYGINHARIQQDAERVLASAPSWVDDPLWFRDPAPESPMNEPDFWRPVVALYLSPWSHLQQRVCHYIDSSPSCSAAALLRAPDSPLKRITHPLLDYACQRLHTEYQSFRAQVVNGTLFLSECWSLPNWQPTIANTKMLILEAIRQFGPNAFPPVDFTGNQWDNDLVSIKGLNTSALEDDTIGLKWAPLPIFSPVRQPGQTVDVPFPDFSFMLGPSNEFKTPPWDYRRRMVAAIASRIPWEARSSLAIWSGSVGTEGSQRQELKAVAEENPELLFVNDYNVYISRVRAVRKCRVSMPGELTVGRGMGSSTNACQMDFHDLCKFKYLVHIRGGVGGMTYSNRLKDLLLCGSVVLYVDYPWQEFFEPLLQPWVHYVPVPTVADLPAVIRELQQNEREAKRIGWNGAEFARGMGSRAVSAYVVELFRQYAALQDFVPEGLPDATAVRCPRDLYEHYKLPLEEYPLYPCMKETPALLE